MSVQSAESKATSEFSGSNFGIGLLCGIGLIFVWNALLDVLQVPFVPSFNKEADLSTRLLSLLRTAPDSGFMLGMYVIIWRKAKTPLHKLISVTLIWALVGGYSLIPQMCIASCWRHHWVRRRVAWFMQGH
jgi:hypothetical protein